MKPVLFSPQMTDFATNGIGTLFDCTSCQVTEERNGIYELEMKYPITGKWFENLVHSAVIKAPPAPNRDPEPFRIYRITKPIQGIVTIYAEHISYQLSHIPVRPFTASNVQDALQGLKENAIEECPFEFWTDKTVISSYTVTKPTSIRKLLGGSEGSILQTYGTGEYEFSTYQVNLYLHRGADRGVKIRYGKNLTDLTQEENIENTVTGIVPYWTDESGTILVMLPEGKVECANAGNFPYRRTIEYDFSSEFEEAPTAEQLRNAAEAYIRNNDIGKPKTSLSVSFIALAQTEDYKSVAMLEDVQLCDTVTVEYEKLGVSVAAKVIKTVYDSLQERYEKIELGEPKGNLSSTINSQEQGLKQEIRNESSKREQALKRLADRLAKTSGLFMTEEIQADQSTVYYMHNKPTLGESDIVWRLAAEAFAVSTDGGRTYPYGFTVDGEAILERIYAIGIDASYINAGIINADLIRAGTLVARDEEGNIVCSINTKTGEVYINASVIQMKSESLETYVNGIRQTAEDAKKIAQSAKTLTLILDNETHTIPTDAAGANGDYTGCSCGVMVLYGSSDVTAGAVITAAAGTGVTGTWDAANKRYTVSNLSEDTGIVEFTAAYNNLTVTKTMSVSKARAGADGKDGADGIQGPPGTDGRTSYFHVKYAPTSTPSAAQMTETPSEYIGTYVDFTQADSNDPSDYTWVKLQGADGKDGTDGIPGTNGTDGKTSYLHIKYSDDGGISFTANSGETAGKYIGQYVDFTKADSSDVGKYTWALLRGADGTNGIDGKDGADGKTYYTWLKYADTPTSGMSESPDGKSYIGLAYNKETAAESTNYSDYTWSLIKGKDGVNGGKGADGKTYYTWIKYATSASGANMSDDPAGKTYIGLAYNKETAVESNQAADYSWSLIKGEKGDQGTAGRTYFVEPSTLVIKKGADDALTPASVTFASYYRDGTTAGRTAYAGRFIIAESADGSTWTNQYTSSANESSKTYTPSGPNIKLIRCTLYAAGGTTNTLDTQSAAIVTDADNIEPKLDAIYQEINNSYTNATKTANEIMLEAVKEYVKTSDLETFRDQMLTQFTQSADSIDMIFERLTEQIKTLEGDTTSEFAVWKKYIRFVDGSIILGQEDNPLILTLVNDEIRFTYSGQKVAWFSYNQMHVSNIAVTESADLCGLKVTVDENGHIMIS